MQVVVRSYTGVQSGCRVSVSKSHETGVGMKRRGEKKERRGMGEICAGQRGELPAGGRLLERAPPRRGQAKGGCAQCAASSQNEGHAAALLQRACISEGGGGEPSRCVAPAWRQRGAGVSCSLLGALGSLHPAHPAGIAQALDAKGPCTPHRCAQGKALQAEEGREGGQVVRQHVSVRFHDDSCPAAQSASRCHPCLQPITCPPAHPPGCRRCQAPPQ
jgi:hypothetical protein